MPPARRSLLSTIYERRDHVLVVTLAVAFAVWRFAFVLSGVDPDSDAYGHHAIARQILETPRDLTVHWVWLPFFHYLQAIIIALGGGLQTVRMMNVVLWSAAPFVVFRLMLQHREGRADTRWDPAPVIAAVIVALSPIGMQMGTTGQTEPLFALLVLATIFSLAIDRPGFAAAALSIAVLLRYEAWSLPPTIAGYLILVRIPWLRNRLTTSDRGGIYGARAWLPVIAPVVAIIVWAALRHFMSGSPWFAFLKETREFANGALKTKSAFELGPKQVREDLVYYAAHVPWRVIGYPLVLVPFGIVRTFRREGLRFVLLYCAILAFLTLTWLLRSTLGLDRHFVVLVPFYAAMIGNGIVAIGAFVDDRLRSPNVHGFAISGAVRAALIAGLSCAVFFDGWGVLSTWMRDWTNASRGAWPDRRAIATKIDELPSGVWIFCDEPTVELLSTLDRRKIDRRLLDDPRAPGWVRQAFARGPVYLATWAVKVPRLGVDGDVLVRSPGTEGTSGLVLVRVTAVH
jgi:hypothetical protein